MTKPDSMTHQPFVTIITPSYNQGNFIGATIDSVLKQDYPNIEYFVIDGGSTDSTIAVLNTYTDPRMVWVSEKDKGQSDAINKGLRRTTGKYITYINSDDLLAPNAVSFIVDYFEKHSEADLLFGDCMFIDEHGNDIELMKSTDFELNRMLLGMQALIQPGAFWRRELIEKIGFMDETLHYTMDTDYWIRSALAGFRIEYESGARSSFRLHGASKTVSQKAGFWKNWKQVLDKAYASDYVTSDMITIKEQAYQYIEWNRLKAAWLNGEYDRTALQPFLKSRGLPNRIIATLMLLESYTKLSLLKGIDKVYEKLSGNHIIR